MKILLNAISIINKQGEWPLWLNWSDDEMQISKTRHEQTIIGVHHKINFKEEICKVGIKKLCQIKDPWSNDNQKSEIIIVMLSGKGKI